jgi:hypothetical protein
MMTWLYRVLENDDEGDPVDFGMVRAPDPKGATGFITERLYKAVGPGRWPVRLYPVEDVPCGVPETVGDYLDLEVEVPKDAPSPHEDVVGRKAYWAETTWCRHDVEERLRAFRIEPSPENVDKVLTIYFCRKIVDYMIEEGWRLIDEGIRDCFPEADWDEDYEPDF